MGMKICYTRKIVKMGWKRIALESNPVGKVAQGEQQRYRSHYKADVLSKLEIGCQTWKMHIATGSNDVNLLVDSKPDSQIVTLANKPLSQPSLLQLNNT